MLTNRMLTLIVVALLVVGLYAFFNMRDNRTGAERIGDAVSELQDRTPAERVGDAVKDSVGGGENGQTKSAP